MKAMQTDGLDWGEGYRPSPGFGGDRSDDRGSVAPRRRCRARSLQRDLLPPPTERAWRHRAEGSAHPPSRLRDRELRPRAPEIDRLAGFVFSTRKIGETFCSAAWLHPSTGWPWTRRSRLAVRTATKL